MITVAAFTGGRYTSPARFRVNQYIVPLRGHNVIIDEYSAPFGSWPPGRNFIRPFWGIGSLASRIPGIIASHNHDITLLQRPMISKYLTLERFTSRPRILDVDDAIWLTMGESCTRQLAELSDSIICGNEFLADKFAQWNPADIVIIPTGVDTDRFCPPASSGKREKIIVGWSGGSGGFPYLYNIEAALARMLKAHPDVSLQIVANRRPLFTKIPTSQLEFIQWSPENEVRTIQRMDIGIMPMDDSVLSLGKCSYKMLLYMACAKPVIVSPKGMNCEVLAHGNIGLQATSDEDWVDGIRYLINNPEKRKEMGITGRNVVKEHYGLDRVVDKLADQFRKYS